MVSASVVVASGANATVFGDEGDEYVKSRAYLLLNLGEASLSFTIGFAMPTVFWRSRKEISHALVR
jgi:hypothetical protein